MTPFLLGTHCDDAQFNFRLPANIVTKTIAILGLRGSGKSNTATVVVEEMLEQNLPPVIIDPTDAWWGLRSKYPVFIFGGSHGDAPLQETDGKILAEFVVKEKVPVVLSLRHLRKGAQRRFVTDFCEELYHIKGKDENRTSLTVVIDEAPLFVPQKVMGETARVVGAVEDLIARGRNSGFGVVLISQRSATINKDVLTQADVIVSHRLTSPQDKAALGDWFEDNATSDKKKEILTSLAGLPDGRAWIWAPTMKIMEQIQFRRRTTFDSSATPELGKAVAAPRKLTEINLDLLKEKMAATIEEAAANDPKKLQAEIRRLNGVVTELKNNPVIEVKEIQVPVIPEKCIFDIKALEKESRELAAKADLTWNKAMEIERAFTQILTGMQQSILLKPKPRVLPGGSADDLEKSRPVAKGHQTRPHIPVSYSEDTPPLSKCARTLLTVLVQFHPQATTRSKVSLVSGYSVNSSTFNNGLSELRVKGCIGGSDPLIVTHEGLTVIGNDFEPLPVGDEAIRHWMGKVSKCAATLLKCLHDAGGMLGRFELSKDSGYSETSSTFNNGLSELRVLGVIVTDKENAWIHDDFRS